jgi:inner membrane protein
VGPSRNDALVAVRPITGIAVSFFVRDSKRDRWKLALLLFVIMASHGLLDAMTDGGLGVAFFSPFDRTRYFFGWRPIHVSPVAAHRFFSSRGLTILWSEIRSVWAPALLIGALLYIWRRRQEGENQGMVYE